MKSSGKYFGIFILLSGSVWLLVVIRVLLIGGPLVRLKTAALSTSSLVHSSSAAIVLGTAGEQNKKLTEFQLLDRKNDFLVEPIHSLWKNSISVSEPRFHDGRDKRGKLDTVNFAMAPALVHVTDTSKDGGTISTGRSAAISSTSTKSSGLRWPPVKADFTIPPEDGYDVMPLTGLKVPKFWVPPEGANVYEISDKVDGDETIFVMIARCA